MNAIVTNNMRELALDSIKKLFITNSYVFLSRNQAWPNDLIPPDSSLKEQDKIDAWSQMFFLKRVFLTDVAFMIKKNSWINGTTYDQYTPAVDLTQKNFYVLTSDRRIYKCLNNNKNSPSTVMPSLTITTPFETSDGYKWKFMFEIAQNVLDKFSTTSLIPMQANSTIENSAIKGTIDRIDTNSSGNNWISYDDGYILSVTSNNVYRISATSVAANDYYTSSGFYVKDGPGAGFISKIAGYTTNSSGNFVTLSTNNSSVSFGSHYYISPYVTITGDGQSASAYSVVDANTATISDIKVLNAGNNYTWSKATISANSLYSNSLISVTPIVSPMAGHGARPASELYTSSFCLAVKLANTDNVQSNITSRTVGVVINPLLTGDVLATSNTYQQNSTMLVSPITGSSYSVSKGELINGTQSGAKGIVLTVNSTSIEYTNTTGTFILSETVTSNVTSSSFTINSFQNGPIKQFSGNTVYLSNIQPINIDVSGASKNIVKIIIGV